MTGACGARRCAGLCHQEAGELQGCAASVPKRSDCYDAVVLDIFEGYSSEVPSFTRQARF